MHLRAPRSTIASCLGKRDGSEAPFPILHTDVVKPTFCWGEEPWSGLGRLAGSRPLSDHSVVLQRRYAVLGVAEFPQDLVRMLSELGRR